MCFKVRESAPLCVRRGHLKKEQLLEYPTKKTASHNRGWDTKQQQIADLKRGTLSILKRNQFGRALLLELGPK